MKSKELRELVMPSRGKIIIFLALFLLFVPVVNYDTGIRCITAPCPSSSPGSIFIYVLHGSQIYQFYYAAAIIGIVATYLIACFAISLKKNVKNFKK